MRRIRQFCTREEDTLKSPNGWSMRLRLHQRVAFNDRLSLAVYNETTHRLEFASNPGLERMPNAQHVSTDSNIRPTGFHKYSAGVDAVRTSMCRRTSIWNAEANNAGTDRLLFELVARHVAIVVFNAVVKLAIKYRDIESAHEEAQRLVGRHAV